MSPNKSNIPQLIVALDNCTPDEARAMVRDLAPSGVSWYKVGLELYTQAGPSFVTELKKSGFKVFLDLKLYDIPNTVAKAVKAAAQTGADLLTVHASGGVEMLEAARKATEGTPLSVVGVTVLTSFGGATYDQVCQAWGAREGAAVPRNAVALRLAQMVAASGLPGIVCSPSDLHDGELRRIAWPAGRPPLFVTPGIRDGSDERNDQKSVATAEQAVRLGSTHLVVGRPITTPSRGTSVESAKYFLDQIKAIYGVTSHS